MRKNFSRRLVYQSPQLKETRVSLESALLVGSVRLQVEVDELENVNARDGVEATDFYFEF